MRNLGGRVLAIALAAIVVVSMLGPTVVASDYDQDQFVAASEDVEVWERAAFAPLYVDYGAEGDEDSQTIVRHPEPILATQDDDIGDAGLNRHRFGVWGTDQTIPLVFEDRAEASTPVDQFQGHEWDLVVARTNASSVDLAGAENGSLFRAERALELLEEDADADVRIADTQEFDESSMSFAVHPDEAGAYAFFLVNNGSVTVEDGDVTDVTDAKVIGVDTTLVQDARAKVKPDGQPFAPGENVSLDVDANFPDDGESRYTHTVLLFDEDDFVYAEGSDTERIRLEFDGDASDLADARASDFTLDTSYGSVEGVVRTEGDVDAFGIDVGDRNRSDSFEVETLADALLPQVGLEGMTVEQGTSRLNASLTVVNTTEGETTVEVGTTENFAEGTYDVLYVAEGRDTGQLTTKRGKVVLKAETSPPSGGGPPGGPGPGPGPSPPPGPPTEPPEDPPSDTPAGPKIDVRPDENAASIAFERVPSNALTAVDLPAAIATDEAALDRIAVDPAGNVSNLGMEVAMSSTVPGDETPWLDKASPISYVEVTVNDSSVEFDEAEFTFTVSEGTLEERDIEPGEVHLYRYSDGEWNQLPTRQDGGTYVATSPGFSVFAIGAERNADFDVYDADVDPTEVEPGEPVDVAATVENTGDERGSFRAELTVDGEVRTVTNVTLEPGETREVNFRTSFEEPGTYEVAVSGAPAGTVTVEGDDRPGQPVEEGGISPLVSVGLVLLLVVVLAGGGYYLRRSDRVDLGG